MMHTDNPQNSAELFTCLKVYMETSLAHYCYNTS